MILVTGATGFVGKCFLQMIDDKVRCVVRKGNMKRFNDSFEIDSICSNTLWNGAFEGVDTIMHIAGLAHALNLDENDYEEVNTAGTLNLAKQAVKSGVSRFVFVSTIGINGTSSFEKPFDENSPIAPKSPYTKSKYLAEKGLFEIAEKTGLEVVIVRPTLVYGYNAPGNFGKLTKLVSKLRLLPFGACKNKRSFISVGNLSSFLYECANHPNAAGEVFVISDGEPISTKKLTDSLAIGLGISFVQLPIPIMLMNNVAKLFGKAKLADQLFGNLEVDSSKARSLLGWNPIETMEQAMTKLKK